MKGTWKTEKEIGDNKMNLRELGCENGQWLEKF
jgi:hypothetical protein